MPDLTTEDGLVEAFERIGDWGDPGIVPAPPERTVDLVPLHPGRRAVRPRLAVAAAAVLAVVALVVAVTRPASEPSAAGLADGEWSRIAAGPLSARHSATAVWTGEEVVILGGQDDNGRVPPYVDGARYDPTTDTWRSMAPLPVDGGGFVQLATWTGTEAVYVVHHTRLRMVTDDYDIVAYDPRTDTWRTLVEARFSPNPPTDALVALGPVPVESPEALVTVGDELIILGWQSSASEYAWATIDQTTGATTGYYALPGDGNDLYFVDKTAIVVGDRILFGRARWFPGQFEPWGYLIDPGDASVAVLDEPVAQVDGDDANGVQVRSAAIDERAVLLGVATNDEGEAERVAWELDDANRWVVRPALPDGPTPDQSQAISLVPVEQALVALGGHALGEGNTNGGLRSFGALRVVSVEGESWTELPDAPIDLARVGAVAVWTGREVVVWGGTSATAGPFGDGARYSPRG